MIRSQAFVALLAGVVCGGPVDAATPVFKCIVQGVVTYQAEPCRTGVARSRPTLEQLNAERKRQAEVADAARAEPAEAAKPSSGASSAIASAPLPGRAAVRASAPPAKVQAAPAFRCDGRRYCSQMTSCEEARYFLAHCPDVHMDGDRNGIPCERQWCGRR